MPTGHFCCPVSTGHSRHPSPTPSSGFLFPTLSRSLTNFRSRQDRGLRPLFGFAPKQTKGSSAWRTTYIVLQYVFWQTTYNRQRLNLKQRKPRHTCNSFWQMPFDSIVQNYSRLNFFLVIIDLLANHTVYILQARYFRLKLAVLLRVLMDPEMFQTE